MHGLALVLCVHLEHVLCQVGPREGASAVVVSPAFFGDTYASGRSAAPLPKDVVGFSTTLARLGDRHDAMVCLKHEISDRLQAKEKPPCQQWQGGLMQRHLMHVTEF